MLKKKAEMTRTEFRAWMTSRGLSVSQAADVIGRTKRMINFYLSGECPVPPIVARLCYALPKRRRAGGSFLAPSPRDDLSKRREAR